MAEFIPCTIQPPFAADVHIMTPLPTEGSENFKTLKIFREMLLCHKEYSLVEDWLEDYQLVRFLIARQYDTKKSFDLINEAIRWRLQRRPHEYEHDPEWIERLSRLSETGRVYHKGFDRWQRPVLVFDNAATVTTRDGDEQIKFLVRILVTSLFF